MSLDKWVRLSASHGEALGISNIEILIYHLLSKIKGEIKSGLCRNNIGVLYKFQ